MKREKPLNYRFGLAWALQALLIPLAQAGTDVPLTDSLRQSLLSQGWQEYQASDGSVIYRQPSSRAATDNSSVAATPSKLRQFGDALGGRGWHVEWDQEGSLVLRPQRPEASASDQKAESAAGVQETPLPDLTGFDYWRIERDSDGALLFHPLPKSPVNDPVSPGEAEAPAGACVGHQFPIDPAALPVETWSAVQGLAQSWVDAYGREGLQVGRIRHIQRVYLVSLVDSTPPYRLEHQLAIRQSDGRVMLLY